MLIVKYIIASSPMCYTKCHIVENYSFQEVTYDVMLIISGSDISRPLGNTMWTLCNLCTTLNTINKVVSLVKCIEMVWLVPMNESKRFVLSLETWAGDRGLLNYRYNHPKVATTLRHYKKKL
jgi:hypothetical protein